MGCILKKNLMKFYLDNYQYFLDKLENCKTFERTDRSYIVVDGVISPPNLHSSTFLSSDGTKIDTIENINDKLRGVKFGWDSNYDIESNLVTNFEEPYNYVLPIYNENFFHNIGYFKFNNKVLNDIINKKSKFIIFSADDWYFGSLKDEYNDDTYKMLSILEKWLTKNNIPHDNVYVHNLNLDSVNRKTDINMVTSTLLSEQFLNNVPDKVCSYDSIEKLFLNYNRNIPKHKLYLGYSLFKHKLIEKGLFGFSERYLKDYYIYPLRYDKYNLKLLYNFFKNVPYIIDGKNVDEIDDQTAIGQYMEHIHYEKTFLSLVSETTTNHGVIYLSEKTFKPIAMGHPFMIVGSRKSLDELKKIGYKTFDRWWDESYDTKYSYEERISSIINELNTLSLKNKEELIIMRKEMQEVVEHNFNLFNSRRKLSVFNEKFVKNE